MAVQHFIESVSLSSKPYGIGTILAPLHRLIYGFTAGKEGV